MYVAELASWTDRYIAETDMSGTGVKIDREKKPPPPQTRREGFRMKKLYLAKHIQLQVVYSRVWMSRLRGDRGTERMVVCVCFRSLYYCCMQVAPSDNQGRLGGEAMERGRC